MRKAGAGGLVYSTDSGRMCPACRQPLAACSCKAATARPPSGAGVRVSLSTQGRAGKAVTLVRGLPLEALALAALGKQLRMACGTGGTAKDGVLELQGDQVERALAFLKAAGHPAKRSGM